MTAEHILDALLRVNLIAGAAIVFTLIANRPVRRIFGAGAAYRMWLLVPFAAGVSLLPAPDGLSGIFADGSTAGSERLIAATVMQGFKTAGAAGQSLIGTTDTWISSAHFPTDGLLATPTLAVATWLTIAMLLFTRSLVRSRRAVADTALGPALIGVFRPRLVLPQDFTLRFDAREQELILAHEATHRAAGHTYVNALVELARCVNWFNPLIHIGAHCARTDQELACDAAVLARYPTERRVYAQALLKSQIATVFPPLGCAWPGRSSASLRRRILMLTRRAPGRARSFVGFIVVAALMGGSGYAAWSAPPAAPASAVVPVALAAPPAGLLTALETRVHPLFVKLARRGDLKVVFIGDSITDFWRYDWGGRKAWDANYAPLKAANFGVEGAHTQSVLWRLQQGELDGYHAQVFIVSSLGIADYANHHAAMADIFTGQRAVIAEIRRRQPQAKILIVAVPRGYPPQGEEIVMALEQEAAKLADDHSVFYLDLRSRLSGINGMFAQGRGASLSPMGYDLWAQAMNPTLHQLLR